MSLLLQCPEGQRLTLDDDFELAVGAGPDCAVHLRGSGVPSRLALLRCEFGDVWMKVLTAEPPVAVNGRPVQALARLLPGDRVCFGAFCADLLGDRPGTDAALDDVDSFALRVRGGAGNGGLLAGPAVHLDGAGDPVSPAAAEVGLNLSGGRLLLTPGRASVRVNGWPLSASVSITPGDQIQIGQRRYQLEIVVAPPPEPETSAVSPTEEPQAPDTSGTAPEHYGLWWLIGLAAMIAGMVSALLYYRG